MRPYDVTDTDQLLKMESDNHGDAGEVSILHNGETISLHVPDSGYIKMTRENFNKLVDWYMADQPES